VRNTAVTNRGSVYAIALFLALCLAPSSALAALAEFYSATGKLFLSVDGAGSNSASYAIRVQKPGAPAKVRRAFVLATSAGFSGRVLNNGDVKINNTPINWSAQVPGPISNSNHWADVTSIVKPIVDAAGPGIVSLTFTEVATQGIDGEILAVVFDDPDQTRDTTVILMFGAQNVVGDDFHITLADPINPASPDALADMGLGISFSFQGSVTPHECGAQTPQASLVKVVTVNSAPLTSCAGGADDEQDPSPQNGGLLTVGGIGDSHDNPADPLQQPADRATPRVQDDELYNLLPFISANDATISVFTQNPSGDDNIFFAYFHLSGAAIIGQGIVLGPPSASNPVGTPHTVKAKVADENGAPVEGELVTFNVTSGPNAGLNGTATTNGDGEATFTYAGNGGPGTDQIHASFVDPEGITRTSNAVTKEWTSSGCEDAEGPCLSVSGSADEDYFVTIPPNPTPQLSPGRKVHVQTGGLQTLQVTKTGQVFPLGPCRRGLAASAKVTVAQMIDAVTGNVLSTKEVAALRATFTKLRRLSALKKQGLLAAPPGSGEFDVKVFSLNPATLTIAQQHGCQGVQLKTTFKVVGLNALGNPVITVQGNGSRTWHFE
jgi:hypothetical protein